MIHWMSQLRPKAKNSTRSAPQVHGHRLKIAFVSSLSGCWVGMAPRQVEAFNLTVGDWVLVRHDANSCLAELRETKMALGIIQISAEVARNLDFDLERSILDKEVDISPIYNLPSVT